MRVFGEKVTQVLRSQLIKRLEDHNLRLITNEFFNGLPTQPFDERSARGIKAAVGYDSGSTILKLSVMESRLRISISWEGFPFFNRIEILSHLHHNNINSQILQSDWYSRSHGVWA